MSKKSLVERLKPKSKSAPVAPVAPVVAETTPEKPVAHDSASVLESQTQEKRPMQITLTRDHKQRRSTAVVYMATGLRSAVRIAKTAFVNGEAPAELTIVSDSFAEPRKPRSAMTPEERKAARLARPKPTLAELIAKREKSLAALKAKAQTTEAVSASL